MIHLLNSIISIYAFVLVIYAVLGRLYGLAYAVLIEKQPNNYSSDIITSNKHAERVQINKSHWINNVSRAHFIGRERFPKHHVFVF